MVIDQAVTPATPDGRSAVFPTLQLRISDLRVFADQAQQRGLGVRELTVGAVCADDPDAICVPLGLTQQPTPAMSSSTCRPDAVPMS